jgi:hypothetical protein
MINHGTKQTKIYELLCPQYINMDHILNFNNTFAVVRTGPGTWSNDLPKPSSVMPNDLEDSRSMKRSLYIREASLQTTLGMVYNLVWCATVML